MNFISCLNPRVFELYGEQIVVPCGKCVYCKYIRNISIAERLRLEVQHHKYCIFFTLKYSDIFLPRMLYSDKNEGFYVSNETVFDAPVEQDSGLFFSWKLFDDDRQFVDNCVSLRGFVPRLRKYDVQCFMKRLRVNINRLIPDSNESKYVSYAICGEYGPTSFRPHYHGLLFFDNFEIAKKFRSLLLKSWPYGSSSFRFVSDENSARYVAQYVNSNYHLPTIYQAKEICPFILLSKKNPVGYSAISSQEVQKSFNSCSPEIVIYDRKRLSNTSIPLWRSLEAKLYPRITGFNCLANWQRIGLYRFVNQSRYLNEFKERVIELLDPNVFYHVPLNNSFIRDYFFCVVKEQFSNHLISTLDLSMYFNSLRISKVLDVMFYTVKRFYANIKLYDITEDDYFFKIDKYFHNKALYMLQRQFEFENSWLPRNPEWLPFLLNDIPVDMKLDLPPVRDSLIRIHNSIVHSKKNRAKREYLSKHPEYKVLHRYSDMDNEFCFI